MISHLKRFWTLYGSALLAIGIAVWPQVSAIISKYPKGATIVGIVSVILAHLSPSPASPPSA